MIVVVVLVCHGRIIPPRAKKETLPSLVPELLIVAGMVYDWRTRGRPHPAWLIGASIMDRLQNCIEPAQQLLLTPPFTG